MTASRFQIVISQTAKLALNIAAAIVAVVGVIVFLFPLALYDAVREWLDNIKGPGDPIRVEQPKPR